MIGQDNSEVPAGEPSRDGVVGPMLREMETGWSDPLTLSRLQHRISIAVRQQVAARRRAVQPSWWELVARAARPLPFGIAAVLLIGAVTVLTQAEDPRSTAIVAMTPVPSGSSTVVLASDAGAAEVLDALIPPTSSDSLLARAFAKPLAVGQ